MSANDKQRAIYAEWDRLCAEHHAARDAYNAAFAPVNAAFRSIGEGRSSKNPSMADIEKMDAAWDKMQEIRKRMKEFVAKHT
jgi:hypothetical protein